MFRSHPVLGLLTILYLIGVAFVTLGPQPLNQHQVDYVLRVTYWAWNHGFHWVTYAHLEFTANIVMFFPVGLFFLLLFGRRFWWLAVVVAVAISCGIETAQLWIPGRVSDIRDVESNGLGGFLGVIVGLLLTIGSASRQRRLSQAKQARKLAKCTAQQAMTTQSGYVSNYR